MIRLPDDKTVARFAAKVEEAPDGCWMWTAARFRKGYGAFAYEGRVWRAHRLTYLWFVGPISAALELDHLCRHRACVNPAHLEQVTHRENVLRGDVPWARALREQAA